MPDAPRAFDVQSHRGPYRVHFSDASVKLIAEDVAAGAFFLLDERVGELYPAVLNVLAAERVVPMIATEPNKNLNRVPELAHRLLGMGLRKGSTLVAIGGGITQDVACFLASVLMRGIQWKFYPTTLLAQADSCIGSKSSINVGSVKNSAGTFWPPASVVIDLGYLPTLSDVEMRSGVGEMIKVHIIDGPRSFDTLAAEYERLFSDRAVLEQTIRRSLEIKRRIIEVDEFDAGPRQVLNYGHTFGHAIESATNHTIPHGIAITIGMDMANYVAVAFGRLPAGERLRMRTITARNARGFESVPVPFEAFVHALRGDKKASASAVTAILPGSDSVPQRVSVPLDDSFFGTCRRYFADER